MLQGDPKLCYAENIFLQSPACVILHNMLLMMHKNGDFRKNMEQEGQLFEDFTELLEEGQE